MNDPGRQRPIHLPGRDLQTIALPAAKLPGGPWFRLHDPHYPALDFSRRRGSRFTPEDGLRSTLYVAANERTCFLECFGDAAYARTGIAQTRWFSRRMARIVLPEICVCDLRDPAVLAALRVEKGTIFSSHLAWPQAWAREIMGHRSEFDGIAYGGRFDDALCIALFDTPRVVSSAKQADSAPFAESELAAALIEEFEISLI